MVEKDVIAKEKVASTGLFDFSGFYTYAHNWLKYEEYITIEQEYSEKISGNNRDVIIKWKAFKTVSDYFRIEHEIKFEARNLSDVEVEIDGKKKKTNKGDMTVEIKGTLARDPDSGWEGNAWWKFLREVYDKYVIPKRVDDMKEKVAFEVRDFKEALKNYLDLSGRR